MNSPRRKASLVHFQAGLLVRLALALAPLVPLAGCATWHSTAGVVDQRSIEKAVGRVRPSLVRIKVVEPAFYEGRENKQVSFGSGTIITPEGHIVTNHHVAGKAVQLVCTMPNREEIPAVLVGTDPATDIAVIKLTPAKSTVFPVAEFGDSSTVRAGQRVLALGSPHALSQSVTLGIIANAEMVMPEFFGERSFELDGEDVGELVRWFGHDAAIFPGNSGGPLIDLEGRIIGVNEIGVGLGGAIPGNLARQVAEGIIAKGRMERAFLGLLLQPSLKGASQRDGVLVASVFKDSPADVAGVKPGDVLLAVNGQAIEGRFREDLPGINNLLATLPLGAPVALSLRGADGTVRTAEATPESRQPALVPERELRAWGLTARDVTYWKRQNMARPKSAGVLITSTRPGGPVSAAKPDLKEEDILLKVGGQEVTGLDELERITAEITKDRKVGDFVPTLVTFEREGETIATVVDVGVAELQDAGRDVQKAWLPLETQALTREVAAALGIPETKGVRVTRVYSTRPADFGIEVGDVLTHIDGEEIDASRPVDEELFETLVRQYRVGTEVEFKLWRAGTTKDVKAMLGKAPAKAREMPRYRDLDFEMILREATFADRERPVFQGVEFHVLVDSVTQGGWADLAGLHVGDALLAIDGEQVKGLGDVEKKLNDARSAKNTYVVLKVRRDAMTTYLELEPKWGANP